VGRTYFRSFLRLLCVFFLLLPQSAQAQDAPSGSLYNLKTASFPVITVSVDVYDAAGNFIPDLTSTDFTILEDGLELSLDVLDNIDPGMEFVAAINPGRSFGILDNEAKSRYDKIAAALGIWAGNLPGTGNDAYSLVTAGGPSVFHIKDPQSWLTSLEAYQPDTKNLVPTLDILSRAIDIASASMLQPGARQAILFVTPMSDSADLSTLQSLALRASQLNVHVFVWVVAGADSPLTPGYLALEDLAKQTGGKMFLYSGSEALPSLAEYLAPMRSSYQLTYTSSLTSSGNHTLAVRVTTPAGQIDLAPLEFKMDIQSPNPILVSPPDQILREYPDAGSYDVNSLAPAEQKLELIIEFPDGHPRQLVSTSLVVDGQIVAKNTSEPFDQFTWDLSGYITSGRHEVQVEVVDMFGLQKASISIPITVNVTEAPSGLVIFLVRYRKWMAMSAAILGSVGLAWLLISFSRKRRIKKRTSRAEIQSAAIPSEEKQSILRRRSKQTPAYLEPIPASEQGNLQLAAREIRFGSDPTKSTYVLEEASIEPLHAIIRRQEDTFYILDQGSIAGTWVNYEMLTEGQHRLKHGDIIQFGQLAYRFLLSKPPERTGPRIIPEKPGA